MKILLLYHLFAACAACVATNRPQIRCVSITSSNEWIGKASDSEKIHP